MKINYRAVVNVQVEDSCNLQANIEKYFLEGIGLIVKELDALKRILSK